MSLIAGYYNVRRTPDHASFREKLNRFTILPSDKLDDYETAFIKSASGGLMIMQRPNSPCSVVRRSGREGDLLLLGFNETVSSARCDEEHNVRDKIEQVKSNDGEYLCAVLEREEDVLHIVNDRFASRPLYFAERKSGILFSTNLTFLLTLVDSPALDPLGWLQMASYSHTIGACTTFKDIRQLDPATHLVGDRRGIRKKRYWQLQHEVENGLDADAVADSAFQAFREGGRARMHNQSGIIALSGGLDSRLVAAVAPPSNFLAFTFTDSASGEETSEANVAAEVAQRLGLDHHVAPMPRSHISDVAEQIVRLTGGLTPVQHPAATIHFIQQMKRSGHGFLAGGGPGDVLPGSYIPSAEYADLTRTEELVRNFAIGRKRFTRSELKQVFRRDVVEAWYSDLDRSVLESFEDIEGPTAAHRVTAWAMRVRQPSFTFASPIHAHPDVAEATPHLSYSYVDHLLRLPAEWLIDKRFYKYLIWQMLPELRDVRYANTGEKLSEQFQLPKSMSTTSLRRYGKKALAFPVRYLRRMKRRLVGQQPGFHDELFHGDQMLTESIRQKLHAYDSLSEVFDIPHALTFIDRYQEGKRNRYTELYGTLATACYACKNIRSY
jgi:asparagine synthase (glutamine-hydrolysing)